MKRIHLYLFFCFSSITLAAQENTPLLNVFLRPESFDFFQSEVPFVNFVIDRQSCDVQWQSVAEPVGNGSTRYHYLFLGYGKFEGQNDTITWHTEVGENEGSIREKSLLAFKQGLLPYLLQTPLAQSINYQVGAEFDHKNTPDPWEKWTFKPGLEFDGRSSFFKDSNPLTGTLENNTGSLALRPSFSFWHISEKWKVSGALNYLYFQDWERSNTSSSDISRKQGRLELRLGGVYSLSPDWSVGAGYARSEFWIHDSRTNIFPSNPYNSLGLGVEYSFLPYREYFRRRLVAGYAWGTSFEDNSTIETPDIFLRNHQVYAEYAKISRWGYFLANAYSTFDYKPDEWTRFSLGSSIHLAINLGKNIYTTLTINGAWGNSEYDLASINGIPIVQSRNVRSGRYDFSLGIDYYFGSGYRNVVNPRLYAAEPYF